ncbi:hypothetical protein DOY81_004826 [Sarcophaga bullata]|nr:hypothetical protein DOY81_004826 [Sarcophaga bullata]
MRNFLKKFLLLIVLNALHVSQGHGLVIKFTKLECRVADKEFVEFENCHLKAIGRDKVTLNVKANLLKKPLSAQLFRKSADFRPFLYNDTFDYCAFMRNSNRYMFWKTVAQELTRFSNLNHTCPYDHDIIVKDMILDQNILLNMPFPSNDYMIQLKFRVYGELKGQSCLAAKEL